MNDDDFETGILPDVRVLQGTGIGAGVEIREGYEDKTFDFDERSDPLSNGSFGSDGKV